MSDIQLLLVGFFVLVIIRVPIAFAMILASVLVMLHMDMPLTSVANNMYASINSFPLLAVPFFMLLGQVMNVGGVTDRLVNVSNAWVGHIRGGLGHVNVLVSMLFAGLSGSGASDTAGVGSIMIPTMYKAGFSMPFTVAITAASSTLGVIIPPSIMMVLYGALAQISIGALFLAGIVPGVLIGLSQMFYCWMWSRRYGAPVEKPLPYRERLIITFKAIPPLMLPLIILGGITFGIYTATEAAAIAAFLGLVLVLFVYRETPLRRLPSIFSESCIHAAMPMICVAGAGILGWLIAYLDAPAQISDWILSVTNTYYGVFGMVVLAMLVLGTFLSPVATVVIFMPIIQSLGQAANLEPIHLGLIVNLTLALGMVTPPYGICLLIASELGGISAPRAFLSIVPMFLLALGIIVAGIFWPDLFLCIPKHFMPGAFAH